MPRALAIFAALCLLAAVAYALWPDGAGRDPGRGEDPSTAGAASGASSGVASKGSSPSSRTGRRPEAAGTGTAGTVVATDPEPEPDGTIRVEVQSQKAPLPGARVRIYRRGLRDPNTNRVGWTPMGSGKTGKDGVASFRAGPGRYVAVAEADRLGRASKVVVRAAGDAVTRVVLGLSEARVLNGRVQVKRTREPVPLADVAVVPADPDAENALEETPPEERLTMRADEKGAFRFKGLGAGAYQVIATAPGYGRDEE
ncbi:MAG TPA: carboxypeptidase regulatory-like domain-containing protein, partial [Myxococcaceae bacterium]